MTLKKALSLILLACIAFFLGWLTRPYQEKNNALEAKNDTVTVVRRDTVSVSYPIPQYVRTTDSVYITLRDTTVVRYRDTATISLPVTQKYYSSDNYRAWVSGYEPRLDSIMTFNKTVTKTVTKEVEHKTTDLYIDAGSMMIKGDLAPNMGLSVKFRNNFVLGGKVGYYDKSLYYGFNVGFKIK